MLAKKLCSLCLASYPVALLIEVEGRFACRKCARLRSIPVPDVTVAGRVGAKGPPSGSPPAPPEPDRPADVPAAAPAAVAPREAVGLESGAVPRLGRSNGGGGGGGGGTSSTLLVSLSALGNPHTFGSLLFDAFSAGDVDRLKPLVMDEADCVLVHGPEEGPTQMGVVRARLERDLRAKREAYLREGPREYVRFNPGEMEPLGPQVFRFRRGVLHFRDASGERRLPLSTIYKVRNRFRVEFLE